MKICDFTKSFFHFETDLEKQPPVTVTRKQPFRLNQVRIPPECRCEVTDPQTGTTAHYVLGASCKTEGVNVDRDIWSLPNADFCVVSSDEEFLIIKRFECCDPEVPQQADMARIVERQVGASDEAWSRHSRNVQMVEGRVLETAREVTEATLGDRPLVSRTAWELPDGKRVMIEYPVKTINVSQRDDYYQVDTGPVLFVDPAIGHDQFVGNFRLAYIAHNSPDWAEFIVNVPTPLPGGLHVDHYSKPVRLDVQNQMIELVTK